MSANLNLEAITSAAESATEADRFIPLLDPATILRLVASVKKAEGERRRLLDKVREYEAWAERIAHDDRVTGWVHGEDYGLYLLLADPEIETELPV